MLHLIEVLLLFSALAMLAVGRASRFVWTPLIGVILFTMTVLSHVTLWIQLPLWFIYLSCAFVFNAPITRRKYLIKPLFQLLKDTVPKISETERAALDCGDVWWERELFSGRPNWQQLIDMPTVHLTDEEQQFLDNEVVTLCDMIDDWDIVHQQKQVPQLIWDYLKQHGFFGLVIDKAYGGKGFSAYAHSCIVCKIATRSVSVAVTMMVPNSLGPGELLMHYGTNEQKQQYLPALATGKAIPCFALTSQEAGSDAASITDFAIVCEETFNGKPTLGMRITWNKRYITLAPKATLVGLAFQLYDPEHLLGNNYDVGITLALLPHDHLGVEIGACHMPMGLAFANGTTRGNDVFIPMDWVIGGKDQVGCGWEMLMSCLSIGRAISLPALSTAAGSLCYRATGIYCYLRKQFKTRIGYFEGVQASLAQIAGLSFLLEATRAFTASAVDQKVKPAVASAIAKYHMTEMNRQVINHAMDIHGGRAIQMGPKNYLAIPYKAVPIGITVEGANILTRNLIIFGQGAMRCHPFIRMEIELAKSEDDEQAIKEFDTVLCSHIGYTVSTAISSLAFALTGSRIVSIKEVTVSNIVKRYLQQLTRIASGFAFAADCAMLLLGGELKRKERLSARLGDVLSYLYMASAVIKYYQHAPQDLQDESYLCWAMDYCLYHSQQALSEFIDNFPQPLLRIMLKLCIFPLGKRFKKPDDYLESQLALSTMEASPFRDHLSQFCYRNHNPDDVIGRMEYAFECAVKAKGAERKLESALREQRIPRVTNYLEAIEEAFIARLINSEERILLTDAYNAMLDIISVDEYSKPQ